MRFPNAFGGVKKIFIAEILSLIAALALLATGILAATTLLGGVSALESGSDAAFAATGASLLGAGAFGLIGGVLAIIAFIFQLLGLNQAGKDEANFKKGFYFALIGVAVSVIASFFKGNEVVAAIFSAAQTICNLLVLNFGIMGIVALAKQYGNQEMVDKGNNLIKIECVILIVSLIASIVGTFAAGVAGVMSVIAAIASIVAYILYLMYLSKTKVMLAQ